MKKLTFLLTLCILMFSVTACSSGTRHLQLEEIQISLDIPSQLSAFTRGMDEDDPLLEAEQTNAQGIDRGLSLQNSYLFLFDSDKTFGVDVCYVQSKTEDYKSLDQDGQTKLLAEYQDSFSQGMELFDLELKSLGNETYAVMHYTASGQHMWRWATNLNNRLYYITLTSSQEEVGLQQLSWIEEMISGIEFQK